MRYYIILLRYGKVIEIISYDEETPRNRQVDRLKSNMYEWSEYDDVQTINEVR